VLAWPTAIWLLASDEWAGFDAQWIVLLGLVVLFAADWKFRFQAVLPIMTPVL
jgi:hypothetical protein